MQCIIEITLYPLTRDYTASILEFIERLKKHEAIEVDVGTTSTLLRGDYDTLMGLLTREIRVSLNGSTRMAFVIKVLNTETHDVTN